MVDFEHQADMDKGKSALSVDKAGGDAAVARPLPRRRKLSVEAMAEGVIGGDRALLGRAITLVESNNAAHQQQAESLVTKVLPRTGKSYRVGVTGVPGVGKSTFIECLGMLLGEMGHRVAVLAVDPSSSVTGGSILGDKTRMAQLASADHAFIRPSPSAGTLGGVAKKTRETMLLVEAAGYDVVLVETVGVGQSETVVAEMTDCFLALMLPGAGDELQGIKRGLLEVTDVLAVNKADGDRVTLAQRSAGDLRRAMHYMPRRDMDWEVPVRCCSAQTGEGVEKVWETVAGRIDALRSSGVLDARRRKQALRWMWALIEDRLMSSLRGDAGVAEVLGRLEAEVESGAMAPTAAARAVLDRFMGS
ncbi:methylmalonyl Co-A mutase-associated GTPase MeaB [Mucisphaera calidilacus]|uniref:Putative GTPase n=1 Tax=Mucisphaera calidilacus TaxID=2527982 RepID=A0A518C0W7_9BACT|nr:methylmalonyl Co-A mutase-associated GTPase MeaB [Mucisphaera calidilacus]QDU72858.1 putative GTPase [Mucisphaera calidilacus]